MFVLIDNFDSFTYNLYQYFRQISDHEIRVFRNNKVSIEQLEKLNPEGIIISPGPGRPEDAGITVDVIKRFAPKVPILGVCLGHQAIGYAFGGLILPSSKILHGKTDEIYHDGMGLFRNIPNPAIFTRYHSLIIDRNSLPEELEVSATSSSGEIMGIRHREYPVEGIQFHPESIASQYGKKLLKNFLRYKRKPLVISELIKKIIEKNNLKREECRGFMEELTEGELSEVHISAFLTAMSTKKPTPDELAGLAEELLNKMRSIKTESPVLDTCGTGGDGSHSFNISSMAALVCSSCGIPVAKHGNRGISSRSGSADFYRELGIPTDTMPEEAEKLLKECGFTFLFAPIYHQSMKHAAKVRKQLGFKTVMNLLGPLVNPAGAEYQVIGVYDKSIMEVVAEAAIKLGKKRVMVVHSEDGLDEISISADTYVVEVDSDQKMKSYRIHPDEIIGEKYDISVIKGSCAKENAKMAIDLLKGNKYEGLKKAIAINAGAGLYIYGTCNSISEGYLLAKEAIESGKTLEKILFIKKTSKKIIQDRKHH